MALTDGERKKLIAQYQAGYGEVVKALEGASEAELDARPGPERGPHARSCTTWPTAR